MTPEEFAATHLAEVHKVQAPAVDYDAPLGVLDALKGGEGWKRAAVVLAVLVLIIIIAAIFAGA